MAVWQAHEAKARFSELLETTLTKGPQIVTRRGLEAAVIVPMEEWNRLRRAARPGLKSLLLGAGPEFGDLVPQRGGLRRRKPRKFK